MPLPQERPQRNLIRASWTLHSRFVSFINTAHMEPVLARHDLESLPFFQPIQADDTLQAILVLDHLRRDAVVLRSPLASATIALLISGAASR